MNAARLVLLLCLAIAGAVVAEEHEPRILVTFADPGLSNASRAGPVRPGYSRRKSAYLVSVGVRRAADRVARDFDLRVVDEWPIVPLNVHCLVFAVRDAAAIDGVLQALRDRPEVDSAQRMNEFVVQQSAGTDPYLKLQRNIDMLELVKAHTWSRGEGASVTIIDTGADWRHPDLSSQVVDHADFVGSDEHAFLSDAHGTAVAGVIGAATENGVGMTGVAPMARMTVLKACWYDDDGRTAVCNSFTLAKAISHAIETRSQVINLSLGGPPDPLLARLLRVALENGAVVVAAERPDAPAGFPVDVPGVIVVGSGAARGRVRASITAPGEEILVPTPGGGYDYSSGSSLSAAQVSGIAALLLAKVPELSGDDIGTLLAASQFENHGFVNACRALADLLDRSGCREPSAVNEILTQQLEADGKTHDEL